MAKKSKSSNRWLQEHFSDHYVKLAKERGYRSRAVFKLLELQEKDGFIKPGMTVVDLGAAPGGWSEAALELVGPKGDVIALDSLEMEPIAGVHIIQGDFTKDEVYQQLLDHLQGKAVDVVLSDMAPNTTGLRAVDIPRAMHLAELALDFAKHTLKPKGAFVTKLFHGEGFEAYVKDVRQQFKQVKIRKPSASRARSHEVYLVGLGS